MGKLKDLSVYEMFYYFFLGGGEGHTRPHDCTLYKLYVPLLSFSMSTEFVDADDFSVQACICAVAALKVAKSAGNLMTLYDFFSVCVNILFFLKDTVGRCQLIFKKTLNL
jgi:hypothetical protein